MKRTLLILCTLLAMAYSAGTQAQNVWDGTVAENFAGGSGTAEDPYQIANGAQLAKLAQDVNGGNNYAGTYFVLTADILLNDTANWTSWNESTAPANSWTPIGSDANQFKGTLDGDGHSVSGIYVNSNEHYQGFVGYLGVNGIIQNIGVKESYIKGGNRVGGVCGDNYGTVSNCYNTGCVTGKYYVGGVCGDNNYGTVTNCYNTGSVEGYSNVGGVCGLNDGGTVTNCYNSGSVAGTGSTVGGVCGYNNRTVTNCYNTGSVTGTDSVGGLCGLNDGGTVTNCYNSGSVAGTDYVGGVCGDNNISGTISNCYNTGSVTGSDFVGGVCGLNYGIMTNCYNTGSVEGYSNVGGVCGNSWGNVTNCYYLNTCGAAGVGTSKTADEFASGEVAWLLQNGQTEQVWGQAIGTDDYPVLGGEKVYQYSDGTYGNTPLQAGEDGFYLISNADELRLFAAIVNGTDGMAQNTAAKGRLTADILLNDTEDWESWNETTAPTNNWTPIGNSSQPFTGTFDGQGHTVSGIFVNSGNNCQGFFGATNGATITNLHTTQGYIRGNGSVGGIVGNAEGGSIEDCTNGCTIASTGNSNGGIIGNGMGVQITSCTNNGPLVAGQYQNGGIAGTVDNSTIDQCVNNANITVDDHAGGIAGYNTNGTVSNCLNKGNVNTSNAFYTYTAGIVANNRGTGSVVKNCLNLGTISGQNGTGCRQNSIVCAIDSDGSTGNGTPADNCYSINTSGVSVGRADNSRDVTEEELKSGIIANLLQGNQEELIWGQTIGADNSPVLGGPEVFIYGDGTCGNAPLQTGEGGFYLISTADELRRFADMVNSGQTSINGRLTADILLNDISNWTSWNENTAPTNSWTPIGRSANPFTGILDGDGHSVSGIYINSEADDQGLVGYLGDGGAIQNIGVKASHIKGRTSVGSVCGNNVSGTISNCYNNGSVTGNNGVGGVCGHTYRPVTNCYNTGSITGVDYVGGVCGYTNWGVVSNCYNTGSITGTSGLGGVCGGIYNGKVTNCYYLTGTAAGGIGYGSGDATEKNADQFQSGEVAWLLQGEKAEQVWGQAIGTDDSPVWQTEGNKVYKLTLQNGEEANALYATRAGSPPRQTASKCRTTPHLRQT